MVLQSHKCYNKDGRCYQHPRHGQPVKEVIMGSISSRRFYVYILCRPNGKPFYVGKGSGDRINHHDTEARSGHQCHKCRIIRKIWKAGGEFQRYILLETDDEQEAFAYEVDLIALHGRKNLANLTDGGEGKTGSKHTPESRAKMVAALHLRWSDPEKRKRQSELATAQMSTPEARARHSAFMKQHNTIDAASRIRWEQPGASEHHSKIMRKKGADPEYRKKLSEAQLKRYSDPDARERHLQGVREAAKKRRALAHPDEQETP
jgi:hypothetical protein